MPEARKKFYLTTPIYYVNARPHIGHAYTTIVGDVVARRHRLLGDDTYFLTGTDEHGQKIERAAAAKGIPPKQFADEVAASFEGLWKRMGITNDQFIRTTDEKHKRGVQKLFGDLYERGFIELRTYTGQYSVGEEMFVEGPPGTIGPDGKPTETVSEENFFFKLSEFQLPLLDLIESNELLIQPEQRRNEVLSFLRGSVAAYVDEWVESYFAKGGPEGSFTRESLGQIAYDGLPRSAAQNPYVPGALKDLSISRSSFTWGVPVPEPAASQAKEKHVVYVWLDALANYMTALGYGSDDPEDKKKFEHYWPADLHLVGKEIIRFHCVYWPAFLLALNPKLQHGPNDPVPKLTPAEDAEWAKEWVPKAVTAHGWLLFEDSKMSKSRGNIVRTETILDAFGNLVYASLFPNSTHAEQDLFAADVLRYFLLREIPFGQDGSFSFDAVIQRYNSDLANGYGNLVSRTLKMIEQNQSGHSFPDDCSAWGERDWLDYAFAKSPGVVQWSDSKKAPPSGEEFSYDTQYHVIEHAIGTRDLFAERFGKVGFQALLAEANLTISITDKFLSREAPWKFAKDESPESRRKLSEILYTAAESIRIITALLYPILPYASASVWQQLGLGSIEEAAAKGELKNLQWGGLTPGTKLGPLAPIFPRADKGLAQIMSDMESPTPPATTEPHAGPRTATLAEENPGAKVAGSHALTTERPGTPPHSEAPASGIFASTQNSQLTTHNSSSEISIDDFAKVELRVAQIVVAERIPKADKLLRLEVDLGPEFPRRQILAGIAEYYAPESLIGRKVVIVANLAPRKMRGLESNGMIVAASVGPEGRPVLAGFLEDVELGARLR